MSRDRATVQHEPRTEAGRALLADFMDGSGMLNRQPPRGSVAEQILAIEAEAREGGFNDAIKRSLEAIQRDQAAERRATVERIREKWQLAVGFDSEHELLMQILDEERD